MIIIIFITLLFSYYIFWYVEKKRRTRNKIYIERRKELFSSLLNSLKNKEDKN